MHIEAEQVIMSAYSQTLGRTKNIKSAMSEMGMNANEMGMR